VGHSNLATKAPLAEAARLAGLPAVRQLWWGRRFHIIGWYNIVLVVRVRAGADAGVAVAVAVVVVVFMEHVRGQVCGCSLRV